jgi:hypothetical protein
MDSTVCLETRFARDSSIVSRKIAEEVILVPVRQNVADLESIFTLNEVAGRIWELLDGEMRIAEIRDLIVDEFEVTPDEAEADLLEFLGLLEKVGAVKKV